MFLKEKKKYENHNKPLDNKSMVKSINLKLFLIFIISLTGLSLTILYKHGLKETTQVFSKPNELMGVHSTGIYMDLV